MDPETIADVDTMDGLVTFVRARLDEEEQRALAVTTTGNSLTWTLAASATVDLGTGDIGDLVQTNDSTVAQHIISNSPAAVLRRIEADRRILDEVLPDIQADEVTIDGQLGVGHMSDAEIHETSRRLVQLMASRWSTHPDYRAEDWKP